MMATNYTCDGCDKKMYPGENVKKFVTLENDELMSEGVRHEFCPTCARLYRAAFDDPRRLVHLQSQIESQGSDKEPLFIG